SSGDVTLDASVNNPDVTITAGGLFYSKGSSGIDRLLMGSGTWTIGGGNFNTSLGSVTQSTGGILRMNGSSIQNVNSSSATYYAIDVANTAGVKFQSSLTVSSFTMSVANSSASFAVAPSSLTVTSWLGLNGQA